MLGGRAFYPRFVYREPVVFIREYGTLTARGGAGFTGERTRYGRAWLKFALWQGRPRPDNASITGL